MVLKYTLVFSQNIDFARLGNEIRPLLGRNFFEKNMRVSGNLQVDGNLEILGDVTQLQVSNLQIEDKNRLSSFENYTYLISIIFFGYL
jgi:hypothetical protein